MKKSLLFVMLMFSFFLRAQEGEGGMWPPVLLDQVEQDMHKMGLQIGKDLIWNTQKPSLKDAVIQLGNGCTGEFVSDKGLVFTNHHCGYDAIASVSTLEHNYLEDGFWAKSFDEEIPVDLSIYVVNDIRDVTSEILKGVTDLMTPRERQSKVDKNIAAYLKQFPEKKYVSYQIKPFFKGNAYYLIVKTEYPDVRLAGTPPASIGKFGGDTDNWMWPRHTGDFSVFRVYAGPDNQPAPYSKDNKPYHPKNFLKISLDGVAVDDFTMIIGFPGRTNEYLTSYAVQQIQDLRDPARVAVRERTLAVMDKYMKKDPALKLKLASKHAGLANYWKFWIGESKGLKKFKAVEAKQNFEREFQRRIDRRPEWKEKYGNLLPELKKLYLKIEKYQVAADIHREIFYRNTDALQVYSILTSLKRLAQADPKTFKKYRERYAEYLKNDLFKSFDKQVDKEIFMSLMDLYLQRIPKEFIDPDFLKTAQSQGVDFLADVVYEKSVLGNPDRVLKLLKSSPKKFVKTLEKDPGMALIGKQDTYFRAKVFYPLNQWQEQINHLMRLYLKAQMEVFPEKLFSPDANFTMRISYGRVRGYEPRDAVYYKPFSHLYGVMEKYIPGDPEFDVPLKLRELYEKRDYGPYANVDGLMVTDWLATNHITGGNSGSPTLDAYGNLVGLAFDGVWEGVMEDIYYRPEIARSIIVDIRYVLFIIDKFGGAKNLIDELTIVHPKKVKRINGKKIRMKVPPKPILQH
ncbi:MAG: S46 family peptidase [Chlorobi bacterium]|nr:S46 family peptidase [Chlorobiota bacterium]